MALVLVAPVERQGSGAGAASASEAPPTAAVGRYAAGPGALAPCAPTARHGDLPVTVAQNPQWRAMGDGLSGQPRGLPLCRPQIRLSGSARVTGRQNGQGGLGARDLPVGRGANFLSKGTGSWFTPRRSHAAR